MCQTRVNALDEYILVVEKWRLNSLSPLLLHLRAVSDTQYQNSEWPQNIRLRKFARISKSISLWVQSPRLVDSKRFYFPGRQLWRVFLPSDHLHSVMTPRKQDLVCVYLFSAFVLIRKKEFISLRFNANNRPLVRHGNTANLEDKTKELFSSGNWDLFSCKQILLFCPPNWLHFHGRARGLYQSSLLAPWETVAQVEHFWS